MLHDYLTPETYSEVKKQIHKDVVELFPNADQLEHEIEHFSTYLDKHLQIMSWLQDGLIYSNCWYLRQCMPSSFSCLTDQFLWQVYKEIAVDVIYEYIYSRNND